MGDQIKNPSSLEITRRDSAYVSFGSLNASNNSKATSRSSSDQTTSESFGDLADCCRSTGSLSDTVNTGHPNRKSKSKGRTLNSDGRDLKTHSRSRNIHRKRLKKNNRIKSKSKTTAKITNENERALRYLRDTWNEVQYEMANGHVYYLSDESF
ncbi:hypothetical protein ACOME3_007660 [Neoechinorhynchus agilis]